MIRALPLFKMYPEIKAKICDLFKVPPDHDHQTNRGLCLSIGSSDNIRGTRRTLLENWCDCKRSAAITISGMAPYIITYFFKWLPLSLNNVAWFNLRYFLDRAFVFVLPSLSAVQICYLCATSSRTAHRLTNGRHVAISNRCCNLLRRSRACFKNLCNFHQAQSATRSAQDSPRVGDGSISA